MHPLITPGVSGKLEGRTHPPTHSEGDPTLREGVRISLFHVILTEFIEACWYHRGCESGMAPVPRAVQFWDGGSRRGWVKWQVMSRRYMRLEESGGGSKIGSERLAPNASTR